MPSYGIIFCSEALSSYSSFMFRAAPSTSFCFKACNISKKQLFLGTTSWKTDCLFGFYGNIEPELLILHATQKGSGCLWVPAVTGVRILRVLLQILTTQILLVITYWCCSSIGSSIGSKIASETLFFTKCTWKYAERMGFCSCRTVSTGCHIYMEML